MKLGNKTLQIAIEEPIMMVPKNNVSTLPKERIPIPTNNNAIDINNVDSMLKRRVILGAKGENNANVNKMAVGIVPANVLEIPRLSRMEDNTGPTDVIGALRFAAIRITPTAVNILFFVCIFALFFCFVCGIPMAAIDPSKSFATNWNKLWIK